MELGQRLKQARLEAGLSQRQLCGDEITRNMLSQIENGSAKPSMTTLQYLADRLGKPVSFFLEENTASPNQPRMEAARQAYAAGDHSGVLSILDGCESPDPIFDPERYLLEVLCCLSLAESAPMRALLDRAANAGAHTPYYTAELERRRLLCLAHAFPEELSAVDAILPVDDRELLLRAKAALDRGDTARCAALLDAALQQNTVPWLVLRGDAAAAAGDFSMALQYFSQAEPLSPAQLYHRLEQCYLQLEDYKMAYYYACKQR